MSSAHNAPAKAPYFKRAPAQPIEPNPWRWVLLIIVAPLFVTTLAWRLTVAIDIDGPQGVTYAGLTQKAVRAAIQDVLTKDLTVDRLQGVLLETPDASAATGAETKTRDLPAEATKKREKSATKPSPPAETADAIQKRRAVRTERFKPAAARLAGDVGRLSDALTRLALSPYPGRDGTITASAHKVAVDRLSDGAIAKTVQQWAKETLDPYSRRAAADALALPDSLDASIAPAVEPERLRLAVTQIVTPEVDPFDLRPNASVWAADISGRLTWATVALVFCLTWLIVLLNAALQIATIDPSERRTFVRATVSVGLVAALLTYVFQPWLTGPAPLQKAVRDYAELYGLAIVSWSFAFTGMTAIGVTALLSAAIATLWVKVTTKTELDEQLRGFKALFNSGAILLFTGVLEVYALYRWPTLFIGDDAVRASMQMVAATCAASVGALFSVLLLATYVPATTALRRQALRSGTITPDEVADAMSKAGFGDLSSQQALRLAQVLAPLLPGLIGVLITA